MGHKPKCEGVSLPMVEREEGPLVQACLFHLNHFEERQPTFCCRSLFTVFSYPQIIISDLAFSLAPQHSLFNPDTR